MCQFDTPENTPTQRRRKAEQAVECCVTAVCGLVLFALVIWGGCYAAWRSGIQHAKEREILHVSQP